MKKFARKLQQFGEKAAQVQRAIDAAPAKAAQIRESVLATAGQIQQLRADVLSSVSGMRSADDARLVETIRELGNAGPAFGEAGFELESVELEMGLHQRLVVQLVRVAEIPAARLRGLRDMQWESPAVQSILGALLTAQELAARVDGGNLEFSRVTAYVGASPSVRIAWEPVDADEEESIPATPTRTAGAVPPPIPEPTVAASQPRPASSDTTPSLASGAAPSTFGAYGASSFFEPRSTTSPSRPTSTSASGGTTASSPSPDTETASEESEATGDWRKDALARFKKMPDLSKSSGRSKPYGSSR
jgi:hypothetical protein